MSAAKWETVIGLEVHVQLKTATKLFCRCPNKFGGEPNAHICPVCAGMPGALPSLNSRAVSLAVRAGLALGCRINLHSVFSRKSYFYPDLPGGFQTSQLDPPICESGSFSINTQGQPDAPRQNPTIRINRIHMEDDAGKCIHATPTTSLVDLNRAGTPLVEIVTEPDFRSPAEAAEFMRQLRQLLVYLDITDGNMEEGSMRCDVNISLRPYGSSEFGVRSEVKNLNSFTSIVEAASYEEERHREALEKGEPLEQETRHYDPDSGTTWAMRSKEGAPDYRYFPNPDLAPVVFDQAFVDEIAAALPEMPETRFKRYTEELGLHPEEATLLVASAALAGYFEAAIKLHNSPKRLAGLILNNLLPECARQGRDLAELTAACFPPQRLAHSVAMLDSGKVSLRVVQDLFKDLLNSTDEIEVLAEKRGLLQVSDSGALEKAVLDAIAANPDEAAGYRGGKTKLLSFFVGQVMRATKGAGNPALINELLKKHLDAN